MRGRIYPASLLAALLAALLASSSFGQGGPPGGSPPGLDVAIAVQERNTDRLLDTPGIVGTGVGLNPAGRPVIRVYTETAGTAGVPAAIEGVPVERVATGILEARAPTDRFPRPVPIGVSSGLTDVATGTIAARVSNGSGVFALSNNHVFAGINTASIGDGIIQPGNVDGGTDPADRIGTLADYQTIDFTDGTTNTIDAAIAATTTADVGFATPGDGYGAPSTTTTAAFVGQAVQKYGRTTGFQLGTVVEINVTVDVCYLVIFDFCLEDARFVDQVSVTPDAFSAAGDSGSLIVEQGSNQPVALLFAGGEGRTIGNPIDLVLQRFGVTIDGTPAGEGPPAAPTNLSALAGDGSVSLSWSAPSFDGGSAITGYRIHRGTSAGGESFLQSVGPDTSFTDTSAVNGTTYYYKVSAVNALGEGPLSNEASATPAALVPPAAPLLTLDDFNRPNGTLSSASGWTNGVIGSSEVGLNVTSNQLACSLTTTCTAWRSDLNAQYGPDAEAWAKIATLPGTGNGLRLYVRLQQPGSTAHDGYMIRTNQLAGTDQIYVDRLDNGALTTRLTIDQELALGDTVLLRASGTTLEVWRNNGSAWTRLGTVVDSTYGAAGYVGVGLRGTTGRLDDFGARTMGAPPLAPQITTTTLADATTGQAYSQTLAASGGTPPYTQWATVSGTLPPGLTLSSTTGALSGAATTPGSYAFTVQVTDSAAQTDTQALTVDVRDPLQITTTSLPGGSVGQAYSASVQASGGKTPYTWSLAAGSLPPGLALSSTTGALTGTPTTAGTYAFTVRADDSGTPGRSDTQALSIAIVPATTLTITTATLPDGTVGAAYSAALAASGGVSPYTWAVVSGAPPPGVTLAAATGALAGTPTKQGRYTFTVQVTDANGAQATRTLSIRIRR